MALPKVWFEREVLPALAADVAARVTPLGPADATPDDPYAAVGEAEGIVASTHAYGPEVMDRAPLLKVISRTGIGYDKVDVDAATRRGIAVCIAPEGPTTSTAEHTVTLMLMVAKQVRRAQAELRRGGTDFYARHEGTELDGKTLGLVGLGRVARRVARVTTAMGMSVVAFDPHAAEWPAAIARAATLEELLAVADVVSVHVPLTDETRHLFGPDRFAAMKPGALFVNTARGGIVRHDALVAALDSGRLAGAGLDVTEPEPLPPDHPLLGRSDVVVTPHVAAATTEAKVRIFTTALQQVLQVIGGERPPHLVNPEVWNAVPTL